MTTPKKIFCIHCGQEVYWGLPRPDDRCIECGKPILIADPTERKQ